MAATLNTINLTSSILVVKFNETKLECVINLNVEAIDIMKIQRIKFFPKSGMSHFSRVARPYWVML